jgi:acetoin:2,6-dichlorophenolindophenol oxidoreductase subunit alpha
VIKNQYKGKGFEPYLRGEQSYDREFLVSLYHDMLRIRMVEEEIEKRYHEDEMKSPIHLVIGQEAISVGSCAALRKDDLAFCGHRTHGVYLAKGGDLKAMMSELYCRLNGCAGSRGGSMHLYDKSVGMESSSAIVAGAVPTAVGAAMSARLQCLDRVSASFFGDAAVEEGAFWEAINFAALKKLAVVFVCENNFFSVCSPLDVRQPDVEIYKKVASFGVRSIQVDGTNVLDVYETTREAVERARRGEGPSFIESIAYRWRGHGGAGDDSDSGYRDPAEVEHWRQFGPLQTFSDFLKKKNLIAESSLNDMKAIIQKEVLEAFKYAISSPNPEEKDLYTHVYSD